MKRQIRLLGIDDCPSTRDARAVRIIGAFFRGGELLDGVVSTSVTRDGTDSAARIAAMINRSKFKPQLAAILTNGIAVAGFNIIDIKKLSRLTSKPVIAVMRRRPSARMEQALRRLGRAAQLGALERAGPAQRAGKVHIQIAGIDSGQAREIIKIGTTHAHIPECLRAAHLIAGGIGRGESGGKA